MTVGAADSALEREADAVADEVTARMRRNEQPGGVGRLPAEKDRVRRFPIAPAGRAPSLDHGSDAERSKIQPSRRLEPTVQRDGGSESERSRVQPSRQASPMIQRKVAGGTVGDRVKHQSGSLFIISEVEQDGTDKLYHLKPDGGGDTVRVFGDVKTYDLTSTTKATSGGITGITLDVTHSVARTKCDGLQAVQVWWGSDSKIGVPVGQLKFEEGGTDYEAFVDGGVFSPWVTLSGEQPAHASKPYYLTADEVDTQVTWDGEAGTIRVYDQPTAVVHFDEMNFETAIVAINHDGKGTDKVLKVFTWGWSAQGTVPTHAKGDKIDAKDSGIKTQSGVSATWQKIVTADYPDYKYD
jgi:hypothetical protein